VQLGSDIDGIDEDDMFGNSVSLSNSGTRIAVSGDNHDNYRGHMRVLDFDTESNDWIQVGEDIDGEDECDESGAGVALSPNGKLIAVGSNCNADDGVEYSGHVRIFEFNGKSWFQVGQSIEGESSYDGSGISVTFSQNGKTIAIGAPQSSPADDKIQAGQVRVFKLGKISGTWYQIGQDIDGDSAAQNVGDSNSISLSQNGKRLVVGGRGTSSDEKLYRGRVRVFDYDKLSNMWKQIGQDLYGKEGYDQLGFSVTLSGEGDMLGAGAPYANDYKGYAQVFKLVCK